MTAPTNSPAMSPEQQRRGGEDNAALVGLVTEGQQVLGTCSPEQLRPILRAYRQEVAKAWSSATAKPGHDAEPGTPAGQSGATSAWLQQRLFHDHDLDTLFYSGRVWLHEKDISGEHSWLEYGDVVIDLTGPLEEVVCAHRDTLLPFYIGRPGKRPLKRLAVLMEALG